MDRDLLTSSELQQVAAARTVVDALRLAVAQLRSRPAGPASATPDLDAQVLLAHTIGSSRARVLAYPERAIDAATAAAYARLVARRLQGEPVAYLVGHREFLGLDLVTDRRALIPRPETELLVEAALLALHEQTAEHPAPLLAADIGTGSGAIALALAAMEPRISRVYAVDVSADALSLARENADRLGLVQRVSFLQGDLLEPLSEPVDLLLANLPYIAPREAPTLPDEVRRYEPDLALYGGTDGLDLMRRFFMQAPGKLLPGGLVGIEFGFDQRVAVEALAREAFPRAPVRVGTDYAGWDRFALVATGHPTSS